MPVTFGPSKSHPSYNAFLIQNGPLGDPVLGGYLICRSGGTVWMVAPASSEVSRSWYDRNDAVTTATNCTSATGWFVPTCGQLQNPGYCCRTYWDSYSSTRYWSSTECSGFNACLVYLTGGNANGIGKSGVHCVRAFRCVSY